MLSLRSTVTLATYSRFFSLPLPPFPSRSLRLSRSPPYSSPLSPTSGPRLGGAARPPPASLSHLHIAVPHAYSSLLARGWKGGRGGPSSAAPNRALASELAVEEGDEILHGRLLELAVEEEARAGEEARLVVRVVLLSAASLGIRF